MCVCVSDYILLLLSLGVAVTPAAITRLDVSPYNNFSLTCNVTINPSPDSINFSWSDGSQMYGGVKNDKINTLTRNGATAGNFTFTCTATVNLTDAGTAMLTDSTNVTIKGN